MIDVQDVLYASFGSVQDILDVLILGCSGTVQDVPAVFEMILEMFRTFWIYCDVLEVFLIAIMILAIMVTPCELVSVLC